MSRSGLGTWPQTLAPDFGQTVQRFPVAAAIALLFTILRGFNLDRAAGLSEVAAERLWLGLGAAFLWTLVIGLCSESRGWGWGLRFLLLVPGLAAIALLQAFPFHTALQPILLFIAAGILPTIAPYTRDGRANANAAFWHFNQRLWFAAGFALAAALLFAGGLQLICETLDFLFGLAVPQVWREGIWTVALGLVAPLHWLSQAPRDFAERVVEGEQSDFISLAVATVVKWVLVPLLLVYTAILYVYAVKIALEGVLPQGRLGPMVLVYAAVGTATVLLAFPTRASGGALVAFFWRWWFLLTSIPIVLLALAAYRRIGQYGLTVERYLLVLACLWLAVLAVLYAFRSERRDLRLLPLSACLLLLLASFGPWGAVAWSTRSQIAELSAVLEAQGRLQDGRVVAKPDGLATDAGHRVSSIVRYLDEQGQLAALAPWFEGTDGDPFRGEDRESWPRTVLSALGAPVPAAALPKGRRFAYSAAVAGDMPLTGYARLIGPIPLYETSAPLGDAAPPMRLRREKGEVVLEDAFGPVARFDLAAAVTEAGLADDAKAGQRANRPPLTVPAQDGVPALLIPDRLVGFTNGNEVQIASGRFWVLLGR